MSSLSVVAQAHLVLKATQTQLGTLVLREVVALDTAVGKPMVQPQPSAP